MSKPNHHMPPRTKAHLDALAEQIVSWKSPYRADAARFACTFGTEAVFEILHGMRRWYSGGSMARIFLRHHKAMVQVMRLGPEDVRGALRGFHVPLRDPLSRTIEEGQVLSLPVTRNHGISSWTLSMPVAHKFSGAKRGHQIGVIVRLRSASALTPLLAPPERTDPWFNAFYLHTMGPAFRAKEHEYLIAGPLI